VIPIIGVRHHFVAGEFSDAIEEGALVVAQRMFENHRQED
jgi:hypothetical protein